MNAEVMHAISSGRREWLDEACVLLRIWFNSTSILLSVIIQSTPGKVQLPRRAAGLVRFRECMMRENWKLEVIANIEPKGDTVISIISCLSSQSIYEPSTMSTFKMSKVEQKSRDPGIQSGDLVLLRLPKGDIKSVKVDRNTCVNSIPCFIYGPQFSTLGLSPLESLGRFKQMNLLANHTG